MSEHEFCYRPPARGVAFGAFFGLLAIAFGVFPWVALFELFPGVSLPNRASVFGSPGVLAFMALWTLFPVLLALWVLCTSLRTVRLTVTGPHSVIETKTLLGFSRSRSIEFVRVHIAEVERGPRPFYWVRAIFFLQPGRSHEEELANGGACSRLDELFAWLQENLDADFTGSR